MQYKRWIRTGLYALVWGYAASIWASISHHLLGLPDLVPLAATAGAVIAASWSLRPRRAAGPANAISVQPEAGAEPG